jgi:hypothetical protein
MLGLDEKLAEVMDICEVHEVGLILDHMKNELHDIGCIWRHLPLHHDIVELLKDEVHDIDLLRLLKVPTIVEHL